MHETGIVRDLIKRVEQVVCANDGTRAKVVYVRLGALSNISPEHLREHFDEETAGTSVAGAALVVAQSTDTGALGAQDVMLESVEVEVHAEPAP
jgi:hydrogenase nickel incorporation protein HypA/HybF